MLSLLKQAITRNTCMLYDDGHLHLMFFRNDVVFHKLRPIVLRKIQILCLDNTSLEIRN